MKKYLIEDIPEINEALKDIRRTLQRNTKKRKGLRYVAFSEISTRRKKPIDRVHFHFLTDDERSEEELKQFFVMACERAGLVEEKGFLIRTRKLWKGKEKKYFDYVLKCSTKHKDRAILFTKIKMKKDGEKKKSKAATRVQKIFNSDWFKKPIKQIRKDIRAFMAARKEAKEKGLDPSQIRWGMEE